MNPGELFEFFFWGEGHSQFPFKKSKHFGGDGHFSRQTFIFFPFLEVVFKKEKKKTADEQQNTRGINTNIWLCQTGEKSLGHVSKRPRMWGVLAMI